MPREPNARTQEDLARAVRAIAREFKTDTVFVIGSQAILLSWPRAPAVMRSTPEIDAYPGNARAWELEASKNDEPSPEASEHIHGLFGEGSPFHDAHGFYIDGVDEFTAKLPRGWRARAAVQSLDVDGKMVAIVAPAADDLIVSKLARLDEKDRNFVEAYHRERALDTRVIEERIAEADLDPAIRDRAIAYVRHLGSKPTI